MISFATLIALSTSSMTDGAQDPVRQVKRHDVTFQSNDTRLVGHLYLPASYDGSKQLAGVVVTGAWTTVKEQMPAIYATQMAERGFAALTFDFRGWGGSAGEPRFLEDPERKTQDILAAAAFLANRSEVDPSRIAGLGVCASAGYMADATRRSHHIRALGLVAPWLHDPKIAETVYGGAEGVAKLVAVGREAAAADEPRMIEAASTTNEDALMFQAPYYTEADRGLIDEYDNRFNLGSWEPWLTYDAIQIADSLRKPMVAVHSQAAVIPQGITEFAKRMGAFARVEWLEDVSQFDFYDRATPVKQAADTVAEHFASVFRDQRDVAAVTTVLEGVMTLVDLRKFDALESLYANEVLVDYRSLSGEQPGPKPVGALMTSWASVLPGFDRTRHSLANVHVKIDGSTAEATADFTADHYIDQRFWQVRGSYRFGLTKRSKDWVIHSHAMELHGESGTRDVLPIAAQKAATDPTAYLVRPGTANIVRAFLESLETKDMKAFAAIWAEDAIQEMPFAPEGFPKVVRGKGELLKHYGAWPEVSGRAEFTENLRLYAMQDPEWVFATFTGRVDIIPTGKLYEQVYGGLFHVVDGKIRLFREYFNPAPFVAAFDIQGKGPRIGK